MDGVEPITMSPLLPPPASERMEAGTGGIENAGHEVVALHGSEEQKKQLAKDFESVLLTKLFDQVKESIGHWSFDDEEDGASEQVHGLFWLYLAQDVANKGGFGMWKEIYQHFSDLEKAHMAGESVDREL